MIYYACFRDARITQLVECHLAKVVVAGSNPVPRSKIKVRWGRSSVGRATD